MNQLEELFNEKLANHSIPPPPGSWERVATNISKKNKAVVWIRWAAVLLIGMFAIGIAVIRQSTQVEMISQTTTTPRQDNVEKQKEPVATQKQKVAAISPNEKKTKKVARKKPGEIKEEQLMVEVTDSNSTPVSGVVAENAGAINEEPLVEPTKESKIAARSIVITYTLDPVVPVSRETQTSDVEQKSSSIGKVVKFARDVKNGDSPIGLKVVKEDLFAHSKKKSSPTKTH